MQDKQFREEVKAIAHDPSERDFLGQHLMRSKDKILSFSGDAVEYGILQTLMEGVASISAVFAAVEADGIPGYEADLWGGISALLDDDAPVKVTSVMPQAAIVPMTLHGNRFRDLLTKEGRQLRIRPKVLQKLQEIHDRRTAAQHANWSHYRQLGNTEPPVRFGLRCPFKSAAVRKFAEALTVCRAIAHVQ